MTRSVRRHVRRLPLLLAFCAGMVAMASAVPASATAMVMEMPPGCPPGGTYNINEDTSVVMATASCMGMPAPSYVSQPTTFGTLSPSSQSNPSAMFTPAADLNGSVQVVIRATNSMGSADVTFTVNIAPQPDPTTCGTVSTSEDVGIAAGTLPCTDPDGVISSYVPDPGTETAKGYVVIRANGSFDYAPNANATGADSFSVTATDATGQETTTTVPVTITPENDAPTCTDGTATTSEDIAMTYVPAARCADADGDDFTYSLGIDAANGMVQVDGEGGFDYTPATNFAGTDSFTLVAEDGDEASDSFAVTVTVNPVDDAPTCAAPVTMTVVEDSASGPFMPGGCTDVDGDAVSYALNMSPTNGAIAPFPFFVPGFLQYVPTANAAGADSFTYTVSDGAGPTATHTYQVEITPVDDDPTCPAAATLTTDEDIALVTPGGCVDVDGDVLTYTVTGTPTGGTVTVTGANATFTPAANTSGSGSYTLTASDGGGATATRTFGITVAAVNDPSVCINPLALSVKQGATASGTLTCSDVEGAVSYAIGTAPASGTATLSGNTVSYAANAAAPTADSFTVLASQGGATFTIVVSLTIEAVVVPKPPTSVTPDPTPEVPAGTPGADQITGSAGDDRIDSGAGDDVVFGGAGTDTILGGLGIDRLFGGSGGDTLNGGRGSDRLLGGKDDDRLIGGPGNDTLFGVGGRDVLNGGTGSDTLSGGVGGDTINALDTRTAVDVVICGAGMDTVVANARDIVAKDCEKVTRRA